MSIDIGITDEDRATAAEAVKRLLAETYALYFKTHGYHWNVEGPHFNALHALFMDQYTEMWNAVDDLAERIRALGHFAPSSYSELSALSALKEETDRPNWHDMVTRLAADHERVAKTAREVLDIADRVGDEATSDVVTPRITVHEKTAWMLRATAS